MVIAESQPEAVHAMREMLENRVFGDAGAKVLLEEFLVGEELSLHAVTDGKNLIF